ncbi:MAG: hypothetical protein LKJ36_02735 [Lactobacillus sp.]|jgi:hypothetical protein|nr:hypothetical protein [Lactobacillus sp.]MCI1973679.1 hypothetical protein [Lactobacillus sp.]
MKHKKDLIIGGIVVIALALVGALFYSGEAQHNQARPVKTESLSDKLDKLSTEDLLSFGLVFARHDEADNKNYRAVYEQAQDDTLKVKKYREYHFDDEEVDSHERPIYYLGRGVTIVVKKRHDAKKTQIFVSDHGDEEDSVKLSKMYQVVTKNKRLKAAWQTIADNLDVADSFSKQATSKQTAAGEDDNWFIVPAGMRGTWYGYDEYEHKIITLTFGEHTMKQNGQLMYLHKFSQSEWQADQSETLKKQQANWLSVRTFTLRGINFMGVKSFNQGAGAGAAYGLHTEAGQTVLVAGSGAEFWTDTVYWKSAALAQAYKDKKFGDLLYRDDSWTDSGDDDSDDSDDYDTDDEESNTSDDDYDDYDDDY